MRMLAPYWTSKSLASDLFEEIDKVFGGEQRLPAAAYDERDFAPPCEIAETEEHYSLSIDLPGMRKEDIKVELDDNLLTVSGERKREVTTEKNKIQRYEKAYGFFKRSFTLPTSVEAGKVEARYENGVLELNLPKVPAAKPRQVEIL